MITVTFDNKLTEQFENYGDVLKWISDELTATSASDYSDHRVKLELLTKEEVKFLDEYGNFDYAVFYGGFIFMGVIKNINSCTYYDVLDCLDDCDILDLFDITED